MDRSLPVQADQAPRNRVVVEVAGKRVEVSLPSRLVPQTAGGSALPAAPAPRRARRRHRLRRHSQGAHAVHDRQVAVEEGQRVVKGETVVVLEAMKMEQPIAAPKDGTVAGLDAPVGATVSSGHVLLRLED